jgi:hypothetical protein
MRAGIPSLLLHLIELQIWVTEFQEGAVEVEFCAAEVGEV